MEVDKPNGGILRLFTPGPVDILPQARNGLAEPIRYHRTHDFEALLANVNAGLRTVMRTTDEVVTVTSSATGAMEAAVASMFKVGDRVLVPVNGKFSRRWVEICEIHGVAAAVIGLPAGQAVAPDAVRDALLEDRHPAAVLLTQCETSTGAITDIEAVCEAVSDAGREIGRRILVLVDATSSLCVDDLRKDEWGVDCVVGASQKGLLSPPGLSFVCMGKRAREALAACDARSYYLDLRRYYERPDRPPFTPAVGLVAAVSEALKIILDAGLDRVIAANRSAAKGLELIVDCAGFRRVAARQSNAVTAFWLDEIDVDTLAALLASEHGMVVAKGQGELSGHVLRVSGIGKGRRDVLAFGRSLEACMRSLGRPFAFRNVETELNDILKESTLWESLP